MNIEILKNTRNKKVAQSDVSMLQIFVIFEEKNQVLKVETTIFTRNPTITSLWYFDFNCFGGLLKLPLILTTLI